MTDRLYSGFLASAQSMPEKPALYVAGEMLSYAELLSKSLRIAATLQRRVNSHQASLTAVFADRSVTGFTGILGTLLAGHGYVPLNPNFPAARTTRMLQRAGCTSMVVDHVAALKLDEILPGISTPMQILVPEIDDARALAGRWPRHRFIAAGEREHASLWAPRSLPTDAIAYLLFTSGSTGEPKGVAVTHWNAVHLVQAMCARYDVTPSDRFSQMFDTTFDLSVFDMFVAWQSGACVYCPPRATLINPDRFIREHGLTVWFAVPSVGLLMQRFGALKPRRYPTLRWSLFCGEPLPVGLAQRWLEAAPASRLENLYGPTELTVACAAYRWEPGASPAECRDGIVPIGHPFPGMKVRIVDDGLRDVAPGGTGELLMTGPQRTVGYWHDASATEQAHVRLGGSDEVFYRTGDRVRQPIDGAPLTYVGRVDHQIKVLGHRVELGEIEAALRQEPGVHAAVAFGWPLTSTGANGIVAFVTGKGVDPAAIHCNIRQKLQDHAVPQSIRVLPRFPQNASGKIDRQALLRLLNP